MGRILFIRGGAVGDFILTLPAIQLVRDSLPGQEIEILGYQSIASLALTAGLAERTRSIEHATLAPFFAPGASLDQQMCDYLKSFDVVISYLYDPDGIFSDNLKKAGVETLISGPFRVAETPPFRPAASQLAEPLQQLALFLERAYVEIDYGAPPSQERPLAAIHPGSGSPRKNWSLEGWAEIAARLRSKWPALEFLVIAGEAEQDTIAPFLRLLGERGIVPQTAIGRPLPETGQLLAGANLFLGHDSGVSHLAATAGTRGFLLFGPTNPEIWAPPHPAFRYLRAPQGKMGSLTVDGVWNDPGFQNQVGSALRDWL